MKTIELNGKQYQEYGVVMLPTENMTGIVLHGTGIDPFYDINTIKGMRESLNAVQNIGGICQHLYFVSDEEIKEQDKVEFEENILTVTTCDKNIVYAHYKNGNGIGVHKDNFKKVVAASDETLSVVKEKAGDNVWTQQLLQIPQQFIEYFIEEYNKGNKISKVLVEVEIYYTSALLPSEKYKAYRIKLNENNEVSVLIEQYPIGGYAPGHYMCKCVSCKKEFTGNKRATQCEPCAIEMVNIKIKTNSIGGIEIETDEEIVKPIGDFIIANATAIEGQDGAYYHYSEVCKLLKLQAKEMYNTKEVIEHLNHLIMMSSSTLDTFTDDEGKIIIKWFEQFKKK
jgi:hypothetical protein